MRRHLEPQEWFHTALASDLQPFAAFDVRWADEGKGRALAAAIRRQDEPAIHVGTAEQLLCLGVPHEELVRGLVNDTLACGRLVASSEPAMAVLRRLRMIQFALIWQDMEAIPNKEPENQQVFPRVFQDVQRSLMEPDPMRVDAHIRQSVYNADLRTLAAWGIDGSNLAAWCCADRPQGYNRQDVAILPIKCNRSHLLYTFGVPEEDARMERELTAGSGPETCAVHLSTAVHPDINARRLELFKRLNVPDVILFVDETDYSLPKDQQITMSQQQKDDYVGRCVEAQMPVWRSMATASGE